MIMAAWFGITLAAFFSADWLYHRFNRVVWLHPVLVAPAAIVMLLFVAGESVESYRSGTQIFGVFLEVSIAALALPIVANFGRVRQHARAVAAAILAGSLAGAGSAVAFAWAIGADSALFPALATKSITTPMAVVVVEQIGGSTGIVALVVILSGVVTALFGPGLLRLIGVDDDLGAGIAMGTAGHGVATAEATRRSDLMGAASGLPWRSMAWRHQSFCP